MWIWRALGQPSLDHHRAEELTLKSASRPQEADWRRQLPTTVTQPLCFYRGEATAKNSFHKLSVSGSACTTLCIMGGACTTLCIMGGDSTALCITSCHSPALPCIDHAFKCHWKCTSDSINSFLDSNPNSNLSSSKCFVNP